MPILSTATSITSHTLSNAVSIVSSKLLVALTNTNPSTTDWIYNNNNNNNNNPIAGEEDITTISTTTSTIPTTWQSSLEQWKQLLLLDNGGYEDVSDYEMMTTTTSSAASSSSSFLILPQLVHVSIQNWVGMLVVCGILETTVFIQRHPLDLPGDYGIGYFGIRNKARHERSLISELENGRLAMMAMLVLVLVDVLQLMELTTTT